MFGVWGQTVAAIAKEVLEVLISGYSHTSEKIYSFESTEQY